MKTTLLFILLMITSMGFSQKQPYVRMIWEGYGVKYDTIWIDPLLNIEHPAFENRTVEKSIFVQELSQLWESYKVKCYNDSTYEEIHHMSTIKDMCYSNCSSTCDNPRHWKWIWTHKIPRAEDFLNSLNEKIK